MRVILSSSVTEVKVITAAIKPNSTRQLRFAPSIVKSTNGGQTITIFLIKAKVCIKSFLTVISVVYMGPFNLNSSVAIPMIC
jgi:hypothetical protein